MNDSSRAKNSHFTIDQANAQLVLRGDWITGQKEFFNLSKALKSHKPLQAWRVSGENITQMDSAGAFALQRTLEALKAAGQAVVLQDFKTTHLSLMELVSVSPEQLFPPTPPRPYENVIAFVGEETLRKFNEMLLYIAFLGELAIAFAQGVMNPLKKLPWKSIAYTIEDTGCRALPIVGLLNFLIGVVLTYQMGLQLETYGANIFIVNLSATAIFREFGPLITAIILAGRTASSYTAQIGTMVINEEVDALRTLGIWPMERLVLPKLIGTVVALPLLTLWADALGVFGSMVMSNNMLGIHYQDFLVRMHQEIDLKTLLLGLAKTPVFAMIIASVGCFQGLQVSMSASSVGRKTTQSVVQCIFLIIVVDAGFSILFSKLGL